jgi:hypothetical protein
MSDQKQQRIVGNVDITNNLTDKRGIKISFYIVEGEEDRAGMNRLIDMAMDVCDRQVVRADIINKRAERAMFAANLNLINQNYERLINKRSGAKKLTSQEMLQISKYDADVQMCKNGIESADAAISAAEKKLAE